MIKYRIRYKDAFCSRCEKDVEICFREAREFEDREREPLSVSFDRVLHPGGCPIGETATYGNPTHEAMMDCPVYREILSTSEGRSSPESTQLQDGEDPNGNGSIL